MCSFDDFTVLNYESDKFKHLIKASLLVTKDKPLLNKQIKSLKVELKKKLSGSLSMTLVTIKGATRVASIDCL